MGHPDNSPLVQHSVFRNLLLAMVAFGIMVGLIFPPFASLALHSKRALSLTFFAMCIGAGFVVGLVNFCLFRMVVSRQLAHLVTGMRKVLASVARAETGGDLGRDWQLAITSNDAIGDIEISFNDMAAAIARRLSFEQLSRTLHTRLSSSVELEDIAGNLLSALMTITKAQLGVIYGNASGEFQLLDSSGIDRSDEVPTILDDSMGAIRQAVTSHEVLTISPVATDLSWLKQSSPLGKFRVESLIIAPLFFEQQPVGIAALALAQRSLQADQLERLEAIRTQFAAYLQNALLHRRIRDLAALDGLTGILNRRFGMRRLTEITGQAFRHGTPFSVLIIDIDHFKTLNDTFGHDAGDAVLKKIGNTLEGATRSGDVACRYGREEFMVALSGTGFEDGLGAAERLRRHIEALEVEHAGRRLSVTASFGVVTWPMTRASTPEELVSTADKALYAAKESGRNRVFVTLEGQPQSVDEARSWQAG